MVSSSLAKGDFGPGYLTGWNIFHCSCSQTMWCFISTLLSRPKTSFFSLMIWSRSPFCVQHLPLPCLSFLASHRPWTTAAKQSSIFACMSLLAIFVVLLGLPDFLKKTPSLFVSDWVLTMSKTALLCPTPRNEHCVDRSSWLWKSKRIRSKFFHLGSVEIYHITPCICDSRDTKIRKEGVHKSIWKLSIVFLFSNLDSSNGFFICCFLDCLMKWWCNQCCSFPWSTC